MGPEKISITFIINGQPFQLNDVSIYDQLGVHRNRALLLSENKSRPVEEWAVQDWNGTPLDPNQKIKDLNIQSGAQILLTLKTGAGG